MSVARADPAAALCSSGYCPDESTDGLAMIDDFRSGGITGLPLFVAVE
jgi:hypothetical protein